MHLPSTRSRLKIFTHRSGHAPIWLNYVCFAISRRYTADVALDPAVERSGKESGPGETPEVRIHLPASLIRNS